MPRSTYDPTVTPPRRCLGISLSRGSAAAFVGLVAVQEICGPSLEALGGWKFSDYFLLAILAGGAYWLVVERAIRAVAPDAPE